MNATRHVVAALLGIAGVIGAAFPASAQTGLSFNGTNQYVTFGSASDLGATNFTVELWFMKTAAGLTTSTGTGGVTAVPLLTKGRGEADAADNRDMNYFFGIDGTGHLVADYEEGAGQLSPSLNHPVTGTTVISNGVWYHAAVVFDGSSLRLYLNGQQDGVTTGLSGRNPRFDSIQHAALGSALTSTGVAAGFFAGVVDEARVWNVARSQCDIQIALNSEITSGTGLRGRFGLNEGAGASAGNSVGGGSNGTLTGAPPWVAGSPFNVSIVPPSDPSALVVTAPNPNQTHLTWTDNSSNETGFQVERSTSGAGGPFALLATLGANATSFDDFSAAPGQEYCYRVRAAGCVNPSNYTAAMCATTPADPCSALDFAGTNAYVTFGNASALQLSGLTIEMWIRRDGAGTGTNTGTGGIPDAVPLFAKGRAEAEDPLRDINYLFGIRQSDGVLCADFEEGAGGSSPSLNHPAFGTTPVGIGAWHHVAATYDGTWRFYLDGQPNGSLAVGQPLASASNVAVSLASALTSTNAASGFFDGTIDEVRVWDHARTALEIQDNINAQITSPQAGLKGRWALNEITGNTAIGTAGTGINGAITGAGWARTTCAPFDAVVTHTVTYTAGPNGTISGTTPQTVSHGGSGMAVTAVPDAGYHFTSWSDGVLTATRTETNVTADVSVTANFAINTYTLTYTAGPNGSISGTTPQTVNHGGSGTEVTAVPDAGYHFVSWSDGVLTAARTETNVTADVSVTANFAVDAATYTLTYTAGANGTISGTSPQTVSQGGNGTPVTAVPDANHHFVSWSDGVLTATRTETNVTADVSVTANFAINTYTLTYTAGTNGTISGTSPQTVDHGSDGIPVTAVPNTGYHFTSWSDGVLTATRTEINVTADVSVTANFAINSYTLTYTAGPNGTISGTSPQTVDHGSDGTAVTAVPDAGYHFTSWSDGVLTATRTETNVTADVSVTASFAINSYTLTYTAGPNGTISGTTPQIVSQGGDGTPVTAVPDAGYHFTSWSDGVLTATRTETNVTADVSVTASFAINTYTLTYTAGPNGTISGTTPQTVDHGASGTPVTAVPDVGYAFTSWSDGVLTATRTETNVTADVSVTASFALAGAALQFNGSTQRVTFGAAPPLGASNFTIETWFMRTGAGVTTSTGTGGVTAIPLVTKGRSEADGSNVDMNYFLGIDAAGHLVADYEEGTGQLTPGLNHPVTGATVLASNAWYHAAAVYDGSTLRVYVNGQVDGVTSGLGGRAPQSASIQHAGLATAFNSTGVASGFFAGVLDEPRVWNVARNACEVVAAMNSELTTATGLIGRWGLNEGSGATAVNSVGGSPNGTLVNSPSWVAGAPFNLIPPTVPPPAAPSGVSAVAPDGVQVQLSWTDNASNEQTYRIERQTGNDTTFVLVATLGANATSYLDAPLSAQTEYCYRVSAVGCAGPSSATDQCITTLSGTCSALDLNPSGGGTQAYLSVGNGSALQLGAFTLEAWVRRDAAGVGTNTGTGGIPDAVPVIAKGRAEDEVAIHDINYFLGIRQSTGVLVADFEEGPGGSSPSLNHPVQGTNAIPIGSWHHVAATYDGTTWKLYLDGNLEAQLAVNQPAGSASTVGVALGSALTSTNVAAGFFDGALDEVRIWNSARSQADIQATLNQSLYFPTAGLVGLWALEEASGAIAYGTAGTGIHGTIVGTAASNWTRVGCGPWVVGVEDEPQSIAFGLSSVSPNPMRKDASFTFALPRGSQLKLEIMDLQGRRVATVADGTFAAGVHRVRWDGATNEGGPARAGVYFVRLSAAGLAKSRSFIVIR